MLTLRCARQTRDLLLPSSPNSSTSAAALLLFSTAATHRNPLISSYPFFPSSTTPNGSPSSTRQNDTAYYFRDWFLSRKKPLVDQIFEALRKGESEYYIDSALSRFNLRVTEGIVLDVLNYGKQEVLTCLKFFDWAGRQGGFHHTKATFNCIFRILSKAEVMTVMLEFLKRYEKKTYVHSVTYHGILVVGYAVAGKCDLALQVFGRMRFAGNDLDGFAYHVLLNSLVEHGNYDVVETLAREIRIRGFQNEVTHSIMIKSLSKQNELERGEEYLRGIMGDEVAQFCGPALAIFVGALCKDTQFERAAMLVDEFREMGVVSMEPAYSVWIRELANAGKLDGALEFLKDKKAIEGYVPDVFRYNTLMFKLLRENRFDEVLDLLVEMNDMGILPDDVTMNSVLCLLCKMGRMDIAMDLYNSRAEFGLSVNCMAYNYLINTLLGDVSVDEAYRVLRNSIEQGYFPGEKTFLIIADALCREGKPQKMRELVLCVIERNAMPNNHTYDKLISALCRASRVDDGYWVYNLLNRINKSSRKHTYANLVSGFVKSSRAEIAARLLFEMQEKGYSPSRKLVREVICCICKMDNPEKLFFRFLEMQLAISQVCISQIYNFFIDGAGHAGKPEFAKQVYEMMRASSVIPDWQSNILLLQSYIKSENIAQALHLFHDLSLKWHRRKLWHIMIVGLCKAKKPNEAAQVLKDMKSNGLTPSIECYEELIWLYCNMQKYHTAIDLLNDMTKMNRPISSFVGNTFMLHTLRGGKLYHAWATYSSYTKNITDACWTLGNLVGVFSGCIEGNYDNEGIEKLIQKCFHIDVFTNNILLRRSGLTGIDYACEYFDRLCEKGYEPNRWSYDIIVHGLAKDGRKTEARKWMAEMLHKGFILTEATERIMLHE